MEIKTEVLAVLNQCEADENKLFLPQIQLDRKLYVATNKCLESIGLKWNRKEKCHIAEYNIEEKLNEIIEIGEYTDVKKEYQFFETPKELAKRMVEIAYAINKDDQNSFKWLEPSAGKGAIINEIPDHVNLTAVELNEENYKYLYNNFFEKKKINSLISNPRDFLLLSHKTIGLFDKILMNPPFAKQQDIQHILHAFNFLKEGGTLVAICSESPFFRENKKAKDFRKFLEENNAEVEKLLAGTFKESGTMVNTRLITITK